VDNDTVAVNQAVSRKGAASAYLDYGTWTQQFLGWLITEMTVAAQQPV
jgi:hypothetical protein